MLGADVLIPSRFLALIGHLCVVITLTWESRQSAMHCLPIDYHQTHLAVYQNRLIGGYGASIVMLLSELITYITGITMFSSTDSFISIMCHASAAILHTLSILDFWFCDWFWVIFAFCSALPFIIDMITAIFTLGSQRLC